MFKSKNKQNFHELYPLTIANYKQRIVLLYGIKTIFGMSIFLSQSKDGINFSKKYELDITSKNGKKERLLNCNTFSFFYYGNEYYLMYSQIIRRQEQIRIAKSKDLLHFKVVEKNVQLSKTIAVVSNYKYKQNFLAYYGHQSIYVTASNNLIQWHKSGALLSPRANHFDEGNLEVVSTLTVERGILVLYQSKNTKEKNTTVKIGVALFSFNKPYDLIWRSEVPIWEETVDREKFPTRFLGSAIIGESLLVYWVSAKNEIFSKNINIVSSGLAYPKNAKPLKKHFDNPIIKPKKNNRWEREATFNPAALYLENKIHLLYRAIGENGISVFGYASSRTGFTIDERLKQPIFSPPKPLRKVEGKKTVVSSYASGGSWAGCEDPRITQIGSRVYMTYVSFNGNEPPGVALTSISVKDFLNKVWKWKHPVLISKPGEIQKNWMIFPEKINGKFAILHSITPKIAIEYTDDLDSQDIVIESKKSPGNDEHRWDNVVRGAGAPPLKTKYGWLILYHAMDKRDPNRYKVGAMILDYDNPQKILHRSLYPVLEPSEKYENEGAKSGVVYVCGAVIKDDMLIVYYGGADSVVCVASENIDEFLEDLTKEVADEELSLLEKINNLN